MLVLRHFLPGFASTKNILCLPIIFGIGNREFGLETSAGKQWSIRMEMDPLPHFGEVLEIKETAWKRYSPLWISN
jgi:hypothetical protein